MLEPTSEHRSDRDAAAAAERAKPVKPRFLVIDDDKLHRMIICRAADKAGFAPAGAATYEEAQKFTRDSAFDCIALDLSLGPHAGVEILHHLRSIGCQAPILIISACDSPTCAETVKLARSLNLQICATIPKPVDLAVLQSWLERLKAERQARAVAA